jgi:RNA polymerase sigma-70 factor, ECF subfamily
MSQTGPASFSPPTAPRSDLDARFTRLYERYSEPLWHHLYRLVGEPQLARDLTQEAFCKAWQALPRFRPEYEQGWLYRIATNVAIDHTRHARLVAMERLESAAAARAARPPVAPDDPEREAVGAEVGRQVRAVLARLDPRHALALALYYLRDLPYAECARRLGLAVGTFKTLLHRARAQFARVWPLVTGEPLPTGTPPRTGQGTPWPRRSAGRGTGLRYRTGVGSPRPWIAEPYDPATRTSRWLGAYPTREAAAAAVAAWRAAGGVQSSQEGVPA